MSGRRFGFVSQLSAVCVGLLTINWALAADYRRGEFGALPDGDKVESVTLRNERGVTATVITYGAALQSLIMPDRNGHSDDVQLGYASLGKAGLRLMGPNIRLQRTTMAIPCTVACADSTRFYGRSLTCSVALLLM